MVSSFKNVVMNNYANFNGRLGVAEFWWFYLLDILIMLAILIVAFAIFRTRDGAMVLGGIYTLILLLPLLAAEVRRLHDTGISGWWLLLSLIPYLGGFIVLMLLMMPSKPAGERFGPYTDNADA
jgi:uncharacterized membrane protein YhaH (DUF805 family)